MTTTSESQNNKRSATETGHAKIVANFQNLIAFVKGYGDNYNPSKEALKIQKLEELLTLAQSKLSDVIEQSVNYNIKVNQRQIAFSDLKTLSTRLINALQITDANKQLIDDAKGFNRKIQGQRSTSKSITQTDLNAPVPKTISTSQQSYTQQLQHFSGLIEVLKSEPTFTPNETDLKITTLETKQSDLATKNDKVATAYVEVSNSRIKRNEVLYTKADSIFEIASEIKKYIKSIYGTKSPQFAQVKGLQFKKPTL